MSIDIEISEDGSDYEPMLKIAKEFGKRFPKYVISVPEEGDCDNGDGYARSTWYLDYANDDRKDGILASGVGIDSMMRMFRTGDFMPMCEIVKAFEAKFPDYYISMPDPHDCEGKTTWYMSSDLHQDFQNEHNWMACGVGIESLRIVCENFDVEKALQCAYV